VPFLKEGIIRTSPGVIEEDCASSLVSRCSGSNLDESHLGYHCVLDLLVLEILVVCAICKIM
jgi:hypothetical protein